MSMNLGISPSIIRWALAILSALLAPTRWITNPKAMPENNPSHISEPIIPPFLCCRKRDGP
jgi:hypothetical protein